MAIKKLIAAISYVLLTLMGAYGFFWFYLSAICSITQGAMHGWGEFIIAVFAASLSASSLCDAIEEWGWCI